MDSFFERSPSRPGTCAGVRVLDRFGRYRAFRRSHVGWAPPWPSSSAHSALGNGADLLFGGPDSIFNGCGAVGGPRMLAAVMWRYPNREAA